MEIREKSWRKSMKVYMSIIFLIVLNLTLFEKILKKDSFYSKNDILEDSEFGYIVTPGGFLIGNGKKEPPNRYKFVAICKKGKCSFLVQYIWINKKNEETIYPLSCRKYFQLWERLKNYEIWNLETKTPQMAKNGKEFLEMYGENFETERSTYEFIFRIKNKEHRFQVYHITGLRDKRYFYILKEMNKFFEIKGIWE